MLCYVHIGFCVLFVRYNLLDLLSEIFFNEKESFTFGGIQVDNIRSDGETDCLGISNSVISHM